MNVCCERALWILFYRNHCLWTPTTHCFLKPTVCVINLDTEHITVTELHDQSYVKILISDFCSNSILTKWTLFLMFPVAVKTWCTLDKQLCFFYGTDVLSVVFTKLCSRLLGIKTVAVPMHCFLACVYLPWLTKASVYKRSNKRLNLRCLSFTVTHSQYLQSCTLAQNVWLMKDCMCRVLRVRTFFEWL